jgi:hypothetical protein
LPRLVAVLALGLARGSNVLHRNHSACESPDCPLSQYVIKWGFTAISESTSCLRRIPIVRERKIAIDPNPKGTLKPLGGAEHDDWNDWLASRTSDALPVNQKDDDRATEATVAVYSGMIDLKPADPIEGILISQLVAANQASLSMYQRAWALPSEHFEARMKYLALADKSARTALMITERLDHHRGRGQQQITVKHVTVNADQALVAEQVLTGKCDDTALLTAITEKPIQMTAESIKPEVAGVGRKKE